MKECYLWQYLREGMSGQWLATRIESSAGHCIPTVAYTVDRMHGWLELKYIKEWPKIPVTKVALPLRPEQKLWINTRGKLGRNVYVLCKIENEFFLLNHRAAIESSEGWTRKEWHNTAYLTGYWKNKIDFEEFYYSIRGA